jgi:hypothetical protein
MIGRIWIPYWLGLVAFRIAFPGLPIWAIFTTCLIWGLGLLVIAHGQANG